MGVSRRSLFTNYEMKINYRHVFFFFAAEMIIIFYILTEIAHTHTAIHYSLEWTPFDLAVAEVLYLPPQLDQCEHLSRLSYSLE